jgi:hypothetical protein
MEQLGIASNAPKPKSRIRELLWPEIADTVSAQTAVTNGVYASFFVAAVTSLVAAGGLVPLSSLFDAAIFAAIGIGIRRFRG